MNTSHQVVIGDSRQMNFLNNESVQLVITSPPYWQLKDYGSKNQIGYHQSYEAYINHLNLVWQECYRVLENGCRLCVNIGDQFARAAFYGRYKVIPIRTEIIKCCESLGFDYMGAIIWQKRTTTNTTGGASLMGSYPNPRNGILSIDYEFILLFKKLGKPKKVSKEIKTQSSMTKEEWKEYFQGHWNFGGAKQDGHIAMFPEELPHRLIKMFSFVGDTVLDPFLGSGTTSLAAAKNNRNSMGFEINPEFQPFIEQKLSPFSKQVQFHKQDLVNDFEKRIESLPYRFVDFQAVEKQKDPKKHQFGSKIDQHSKARETYYRVKEILSPELIKLSNDKVVRLIGIQQNPEKREQAIAFLQLKTKGQQVYVKIDESVQQQGEHQLVYLYLKNRTFLNAHLIKNNLATVAHSDFKHKKNFLKYAKKS